MHFSEHEKTLLNRIQKDIPITENPFSAIASELKFFEREVMTSLCKFKEDGIVRNISGIFNIESLGYYSCLIALAVPDAYVEKAVELINTHPGVSHNYLRDHRFNIWFTLSAKTEILLEKTVLFLFKKTEADDYLILKNEKLYKIGLMLNIGSDNKKNSDNDKLHKIAKARDFSDEEIEAIRLLQHDLPIKTRPFYELIAAEQGTIDEKSLLEYGESFKNQGIMRRYSAILRHQKTGYAVNAMTVWNPGKNKKIDDTAKIFSTEQSISHLYMRTIYPGKWEYPLFAMIHAHSDDELNEIINRLSSRSEMDDFLILRTLKEFKKKKVFYFSKNFNEWEKKWSIYD